MIESLFVNTEVNKNTGEDYIYTSSFGQTKDIKEANGGLVLS